MFFAQSRQVLQNVFHYIFSNRVLQLAYPGHYLYSVLIVLSNLPFIKGAQGEFLISWILMFIHHQILSG
jgi:hypothetical protein